MRLLLLFLCIVHVYSINCYYVTSFVQEHDIFMYPETETRLHRLCPSISAHIVNGNVLMDGIVETLLNRVEKSPCVKEERKILKTIGLSCN